MKNLCIPGMYNGMQNTLHFPSHNILNCINKCHCQQLMSEKSLLDMRCKNLQYCCMSDKNNCNLLVHSLHLQVMFINTHQYNCMYLPNCHMSWLMYSLYSLNLNFHCMLNIPDCKADKFRLHRTRLANTLIV